jgi:elongation factor 2
MGKNYEPVDTIQAGGIVMVLGVDNAIIKTGTITTSETASNIRSMKYTISPIIRVAVSVTN